MKKILSGQTWDSFRHVMLLFIKAQPKKMWLGIALAALTVVFGISLLGLSGWFITATAIAGLVPAGYYAFDIFTPSATIRFLAVARTASRYGERLATHSVTLAVIAKMREQLFRGWAKPEAARALLKRPAQLLFRLTVDVDALDSLYLRVVVPVAAALIVTLLAGLAFSAWLSPWLGLALVVWLVLVGIGVPLLMSLRAQRAARLKAYSSEALRARSIDLVAGQIEMLMAGRVKAQCESIMKAEAFLARADNEMNRLEIWISFIHGIATIVVTIGFLLVTATMVENMAIGAPLAAFALLVVLAIFEPFTAMQKGAVEFGRTLLAIKRLAPKLPSDEDEKRELKEAQLEKHMLAEDTVLRINNISYAYPETAREIIKNISLEVKKGQRVALVGASGSGKSTLLALIAEELKASSGEVISTPFSVLTQRTELFQDTLRDNLLLANPEASDEMLWAALEDAGLSSTVKEMPKQMDTWLGEGGLGLSGGQARRLALARLLLRKSPLWLLDEPTEGLDFKTATDVLDRISATSQEQAMLIATHLQREASLADSILVFDGSQIKGLFEKGSPSYLSALGQLKPN